VPRRLRDARSCSISSVPNGVDAFGRFVTGCVAFVRIRDCARPSDLKMIQLPSCRSSTGNAQCFVFRAK
jgi:hypothetical protein